MRTKRVLALLFPFSVLGGCSDIQANPARSAAASYLAWDISRTHDEELVFITTDDEHTFNVSLSPADQRLELVEDFIRASWFDLEGRSAWHGEKLKMVEKTPEEMLLLRRMFKTRIHENAVAQCAEVREVLDRNKVAFGDKAVDSVSAIKTPELNDHAKTITGVYLPVVAGDGRSALLLVSRT